MNNRSLFIIGASGHGQVVAETAILMNKWENIYFLDDTRCAETKIGIKVKDKASNCINYVANEHDFIIGIGDNEVRQEFQSHLEKHNANLVSIIHPNTIISSSSSIKHGSVVLAGVIISSKVSIGTGCIINSSVTIEHDTTVHSYAHLSPGVTVAGNVEIGHNSWLGIGCNIINNVRITNNCIIGAGATVIASINSPGTYVGVPVKKIGEIDNE